ncbi:MAG: MATE family efflux transporter [Endozoicomonas sp.]
MSVVGTEKKQSQSIQRQFWSYVLPTVGAMLVSGLYQVVDGIFIGRYIGAEGLAGVNLTWPIIGTLYGIGMMVGVGSGAISSLSRGESDLEQARQSLGNGFSLLGVFGLLGTLLLLLTGPWLLALQDAGGNAMMHASDYLWIVSIGTPVAMGSLALPFMVRNDQAPTVATWLIVVGAVANILLNAVFIVMLGWGLSGAAIGTTLSQALVVGLGGMYFFSTRANTRLSLKDLLPDWSLSVKTCSIGLSSLLMYAYFSFIVAVHNYLFMQYGDATTIGAFAIVGYIATLYYMFAEGVASGAQPLISYYYGARDLTRMKKFVSLMLWVAVGSGVLSVLFVNLFAEPIINVFNSEDPALFSATMLGLRLHLMALFLDGLIFSVGVFFQSLGLGRKATFVTMANMMVQLPFLIVLPKMIGINGVWLSVPLSNIALSMVVLWMLWGEWKKLSSQVNTGPNALECSIQA